MGMHATPPLPRRPDIRALTGLRGVAACWVMVGHYFAADTPWPTLTLVISHSYIAVDLFMILSGFVLAMSYGATLQTPNAASVGRYVWQRLARIYPLYATTTLICWGLIKSGIPVWGNPTASAAGLAANLLLVQIWGWPNDSLNAAAWSISGEWAASLLFPIFAIAFFRGRWRWSAFAAALVFLLLAAAALRSGEVGEPWAGAVGWYNHFPFALLRCIAAFVFGVFAFRLRSLPCATSLGSTPALAAILLLIAPLLPFYAADLVLIPLATLLVIGLSFERSAIARALGTPKLHWLGLISYSIYLWQMPVLPLRPALTALLAGADTLATLLLMAVVIAVAALSYRYLERPAQSWLRKLAERRAKARA